jgi:hypothetical protein
MITTSNSPQRGAIPNQGNTNWNLSAKIEHRRPVAIAVLVTSSQSLASHANDYRERSATPVAFSVGAVAFGAFVCIDLFACGKDSGLEAIGFCRVRSLSGTFSCQSLTARTVAVRKEAMRMNLKDLNGSPVRILAVLIDDIEKTSVSEFRTSQNERIVIYRRRGFNVLRIVCRKDLSSEGSTNANCSCVPKCPVQ